jgi:hypothetical protein
LGPRNQKIFCFNSFWEPCSQSQLVLQSSKIAR